MNDIMNRIPRVSRYLKGKRLSILLLPIVFVFIGSNAKGQPNSLVDIEKNIENRIASGELVGIFIAHITSEGNENFLTKGTLRINGDQSVTPESIFEIGSISKVFTTLLMAQLMEENGTSLDDEAEKLLPENMKLPEYKGEKILVRHLLTHTSGLPTFPDNMFPEDASNPYADYSIDQISDYLKQYRLRRAPGESFEYSNMGLALVGHILEEQTGIEYEELVKERITLPLQMNSTGIKIASEDSSRLARGHAEGKTVSNWDLPAFEGAGALRSSGSDMTRFLKTQMGLIDSKLYTAMRKTQKPLFDIKQGLSKQTDQIGMGWFMATDKDTIVWHTGGTGGYRTFIGINKETGSGAVVLSNSVADISDINLHLLDSDYKLREIRNEVSLSSEELQRFIGEYKSQMGFSFYVTVEDGQLFIRLTGQSKAPVEATSKNTFTNRQVAAEFTFDTTKTGLVTRLTLRQGGQEIPAEKVSDEVSEVPEHEEIVVEESVMRQYVGTYQLAPSFRIKVTLNNGQLFAQASGQQKFPVYPESKTKFFYKIVEAQLEFVKNEEGKFDKLKLYQAGRVLEGNKIKPE